MNESGESSVRDVSRIPRLPRAEKTVKISAMNTSFGALETFPPGVEHPLVIRHPATRDPSLYFNVGLTRGIVGYTNDAFMALRYELNDHLSRAGAFYVHHWLEGDVVIADNFRVAHRATPISMHQHRILDRTTIRADGVYWREDAC
jgi:alpha-ketoglutarate-dependent taurine dioxygenase